MKLFSKNLLALSLISLLAFSACKKYEEGPVVSLRSKKERVANTWTYDKMIDQNGNEFSRNDLPTFQMTLTKDGDVENEDGNKYGEWEFGDSKETLIIDPEVGEESENTILRLKEDELWFEDEDGSEFQLKPA